MRSLLANRSLPFALPNGNALASFTIALSVLTHAAQAQEYWRLIGTLGGVHLETGVLDVLDDRFVRMKVRARTEDPNAAIVTMTNVNFENVHQVWSADGDVSGTSIGTPLVGPNFDQSWVEVDSHFLIEPEMVAGGVYSIQETNDGVTTDTAMLPPTSEGARSNSGIGALAFGQSPDALFVKPEHRSNILEIAYLVFPNTTTHLQGSPTTIGFLGHGFLDSGTSGGASFGFDGNPSILSVPSTSISSSSCDLNYSGVCNTFDIDHLTLAIVSGNQRFDNQPFYDLNSDGQLTSQDINSWRQRYDRHTDRTAEFGDTNLDGFVDARDLNTMGKHWQQEIALWSAGDFAVDGKIDAQDLQLLAANWSPESATATAVPEPNMFFAVLFGLLYVAREHKPD